MTRYTKLLAPILFLAINLSACSRTAPEGPAERVGKNLDSAVDNVRDSAEKNKDKIWNVRPQDETKNDSWDRR